MIENTRIIKMKDEVGGKYYSVRKAAAVFTQSMTHDLIDEKILIENIDFQPFMLAVYLHLCQAKQ